MKNVTRTLKLLSDPLRLRMVLVLRKKELCVCQIMGVLEVSQSLISKNLHLLTEAGLLKERKQGKLVYYSLSSDMSETNSEIVGLLSGALKGDTIIQGDMKSLKDCEEFQKKAGRCDMKTFHEFTNRKRKSTELKEKKRRKA